jgi:hypothetical protein
LAADVVSPFVKAEFIDDGQRISITYLDEDYERITVEFDLIPAVATP